MYRIFWLLIGFGLSVIGISNMILYLNLLVIDIGFTKYIEIIITKPECIIGLIGIIIIFITIFYERKNVNDLYL